MIHRKLGFAGTLKVIEEELLRFTAALRKEGKCYFRDRRIPAA